MTRQWTESPQAPQFVPRSAPVGAQEVTVTGPTAGRTRDQGCSEQKVRKAALQAHPCLREELGGSGAGGAAPLPSRAEPLASPPSTVPRTILTPAFGSGGDQRGLPLPGLRIQPLGLQAPLLGHLLPWETGSWDLNPGVGAPNVSPHSQIFSEHLLWLGICTRHHDARGHVSPASRVLSTGRATHTCTQLHGQPK